MTPNKFEGIWKAHDQQWNTDFSNLQGEKNWLEKSGVQNIGGKITIKQIQGTRLLVRVIGFFEKSRVGEIRIPLYLILLSKKWEISKWALGTWISLNKSKLLTMKSFFLFSCHPADGYGYRFGLWGTKPSLTVEFRIELFSLPFRYQFGDLGSQAFIALIWLNLEDRILNR